MSAVPCWASKRASGRTVTRSLHIDAGFHVDLRVHLPHNSFLQMDNSELSKGVFLSDSIMGFESCIDAV